MQKIKRRVKKTYYEVLSSYRSEYLAIGKALLEVPGCVDIGYFPSTTKSSVTHYFAKLVTPGKTLVITHDYFTGRSIFKVRNSNDLLKHTKHNMTTFNFNLHKDYFNTTGWGLKECIRELVANAIDGGTSFEVNAEGTTVTVENPLKGNFDFKNLLVFGKSSKEQGDQHIGQFGEGFKLAICGLLNQKYKVKLLTEKGWADFYFSDDGILECTHTFTESLEGHQFVRVVIQTVISEEADDLVSYYKELYNPAMVPKEGSHFEWQINTSLLSANRYYYDTAVYVGGIRLDSSNAPAFLSIGCDTSAKLNRDRDYIRWYNHTLPTDVVHSWITEVEKSSLMVKQKLTAVEIIWRTLGRYESVLRFSRWEFANEFALAILRIGKNENVPVKFLQDDWVEAGRLVEYRPSNNQIRIYFDQNTKEHLQEAMDSVGVVLPENVPTTCLVDMFSVKARVYAASVVHAVKQLVPDLIEKPTSDYVERKIHFTDLPNKFPEFTGGSMERVNGNYYLQNDSFVWNSDMITSMALGWISIQVSSGEVKADES